MQKEANEGNILSLTKSMMEQTIDEDTGVEKNRDYSGSTLYDHVHIRDNRKEQRCDADT